MKIIEHLKDIKNAKFYAIYKSNHLNIIECYREGHKDIVGDIPIGVLRYEMRVISDPCGGDSRSVDIVEHENKQEMMMPIFPAFNELVFEMNEDEICNHVYIEAL